MEASFKETWKLTLEIETDGGLPFDPSTDNSRSHLQFLVDGKTISTLQGFATALANDNVLSIIPPVGGG